MDAISQKFLDDVLEHIRELSIKCTFFAVSTVPSSRTLADGRNAHLIVEPKEWWLKVIAPKYNIADTRDVEDGFLVLATPKKK